MHLLPNKNPAHINGTIKRVCAFKGTPFNVPRQTGINGANTSYVYTHNKNLELVYVSLLISDPTDHTRVLYDRYTFRDGGGATSYVAMGYMVWYSTKNTVTFYFYRFNDTYANSTITPIFYFKSS